MDAWISLIAAPAAAEALKLWGPYAICLLLLGGLCWILWSTLRSERAAHAADQKTDAAEIEKLRGEVSRLQELRLADAQKLISTVRSGTETMAARTEGDARTQAILEAFAAALQRLEIPMLQARSP